MYKIDIIDDQNVSIRGLADLINVIDGNFKVNKIWNKPEDFLLYLRTKNTVIPNLVLIDYRMPTLYGWQLGYLLERDFKQIKKLGISADIEPTWIEEFLATGCKGFIDKAPEPDELKNAIEIILKDNYLYNLYVSKKTIEKCWKGALDISFPYDLSDDEYLYIHLCQSSLTNDAIAKVLDIGAETLHKKQNKLYLLFGTDLECMLF